jgi:hypothetical protein
MARLTDARSELAGILEAAGIRVLVSPSVGRFTPPATLISPGTDWIVANAQLGAALHGRVELTLTMLAGRIAADASLAELEQLVEAVLPLITSREWTVSGLGRPYGLTIAGTEYLATAATIRRQLVLS